MAVHKKEIRTIICYVLLIVISLAIVLASPVVGITGRPFYAGDSSVFKTIALQMQDGLMPYKDTFDHKGPLLYLIHYASLYISPGYGICFFEFVFILLSVVFGFKTAKLLTNNNNSSLLSTGIGVGAIISYYIERNQAEEFVLCFISLSLFIFVKYFKLCKVNKLETLVCGACFACTALIKFNSVIIFVPFIIAVFIDLLNKKFYKNLLQYAILFVLGFLIPTVPIIAGLIANNSFSDFWVCYISFNSTYASYYMKEISLGRTCLYTLNPFVLLPLIVLLYKAFKTKNKLGISYAAALVIELIVLNFGTHRLYLLIILIPLIIPACVVLFDCITQKQIKKGSRIAKSFIALFLVGGLVIAISGYAKNGPSSFGQHEDEYNVASYIKDSTNNDEKILVYENCNVLYLLSERMPGSKFSFTAPLFSINEEFKKEYIQDIENNKPTYLIVGKTHVQHVVDLLQDMKNECSVNYIEDNEIGAYIIYKLDK